MARPATFRGRGHPLTLTAPALPPGESGKVAGAAPGLATAGHLAGTFRERTLRAGSLEICPAPVRQQGQGGLSDAGRVKTADGKPGALWGKP
jgi:hypothetical protein